MRMDRRWFPARACKRDDVSGTWPCTRWADERRRSAAQAGDHELREDGRSDRQQARAVAGAGQLRHAVFRLRHHRAQLLRHRRDRRRRARARARRSQHRAGAARRRAADVRGHDRDPGPRRVRASAAQPRDRLLRPGAHRHDAGAVARRCARPSCGRASRCGPSACAPDGKVQSRSATVASIDPVAFPLSRTLQFRDANLETIALVNGPSRLRRRARQQERRGGRELGELRLRSRVATIVQENRGIPAELLIEMLAAGARRPRAAFAGGGAAAGAARERSQARLDRTRGCSAWSSTARSAGRCSACSAWSAARRPTQLLRSGDLILDIDGVVVNRFREVERAVQKSSVRLTVLRAGKEQVGRCADGRARRPRSRPHRRVGGRSAAETASRAVGPARHRAGRRVRRVLLVRLAGDALSAVGRPTHRRGRRSADRRIWTRSSRPSPAARTARRCACGR